MHVGTIATISARNREIDPTDAQMPIHFRTDRHFHEICEKLTNQQILLTISSQQS
jgi:hypothetical protein